MLVFYMQFIALKWKGIADAHTTYMKRYFIGGVFRGKRSRKEN